MELQQIIDEFSPDKNGVQTQNPIKLALLLIAQELENTKLEVAFLKEEIKELNGRTY